MSYREDLFVQDLSIFQQRPIFGVGVGVSGYLHGGYASHTEYGRLIAEHGAFGVVALLALILNANVVCLSTRSAPARAFAMALTTWALCFMAVNATRIALPAFMAALAFIQWEDERDGQPNLAERI